MHSQRNEEEIVLQYFRKCECARFLDVGAFDGHTFSNTLALAERGWHGVCVEPSPSAFVALMETHKDRPNVRVVNAAMGKDRGVTHFWDSPDMVSTVDDNHMKQWESRGQYREIWTPVITVEDLRATFPETFQFVNVDTEGKTTWEVFSALPFDAMETRLICAEFDDNPDRLVALAAKAGFKLVGKTVENVLLGR